MAVKSIWAYVLLAIALWCSPVSAEYCSVKAEGKKTSCIYKIDRIPYNSQIVISYTQQGWTMMVVVFLDEFAIIEGDATVKSSEGGVQRLEHVNTRRDMTAGGTMMEAAIYKVSEELLRDLGNSRGKVHFTLTATQSKDEVVKVAASLFSDIGAYIEETKNVLGVLFKDE